MTYEEATALLNSTPRSTFVGKINGRFYTLSTAMMKGFIMSTDEIEYLKEWK